MTDNNDESLKVLVDTVLRESGFDPLAITNSELYADFHTLAMRAYRLGQLHAEVAPATALSPTLPKREDFLRLAHKVADIALGNGANIVDPDHDPFTCKTCAQIADLIIDFVTPDPDPFALSPSEEPKK